MKILHKERRFYDIKGVSGCWYADGVNYKAINEARGLSFKGPRWRRMPKIYVNVRRQSCVRGARSLRIQMKADSVSVLGPYGGIYYHQ